MSVRRAPPNLHESELAASAHKLRMEIETLRTAQAAAEQLTPAEAAMAGGDALHIDQLSETERSAATIGAGADDWKPISWMNQGHYSTLLKNNAIGGRLTQQIEAFKVVSGQ